MGRKLDLSGLVETTTLTKPQTIKGTRGAYALTKFLRTTELSNMYTCTDNEGKTVILKIQRDPADIDLGKNEVKCLKKLAERLGENPYIAALVDSFVAVSDGEERQVTVFPFSKGFYTLNEIVAAYSDGIDARDMAWMFNRLLEALFFAHNKGKMIHGSILPPNILIGVENHGLVLTEWSYAVDLERGGNIKAINTDYENWYPQEVMDKVPAKPQFDISMAARCMIQLLGGNGLDIPDIVPKPVSDILRDSINSDVSEAGVLREKFGDVLKTVFGKRKFRPFFMPERS